MSKKTHLCKTSTHTLFRAFLSRASSSLFGPPPGWSACLRHTLSRLFSFPPDSSGPLAGRSTGQGRVACTARPAEQRILLLFDSVEEQEDPLSGWSAGCWGSTFMLAKQATTA